MSSTSKYRIIYTVVCLLLTNISLRIYDFGENTRESITIFVGPKQNAFHANKTLLALHSGYLKGKLAEIEHQGAQKISLPEVNACQFAEFICWIRSYRWVPVPIHGDLDCLGERFWQLGSLPKAPGFQNAAMDDIRRWCKDSKTKSWPDRKDVDLIYRLTTPGAKLRRFAADSVACRNPFEKYREGEDAYKAWEQLFKDWPALTTEVANAAEEDWNGTYPWEDENRERYMQEEVPLDQLWEGNILARRSIKEIKEAAKNGCLRSMIELDHLKRDEGKERRKLRNHDSTP
jgi:hypothetical protein